MGLLSASPAVCGALSLWQRNPRIQWRGQDVGLTLTEYKVISQLVANAGKPLTYRAIYDTMHYAGFMAGFGADGYLVNVRSAMKRIRKKFLALDPAFAEIENFAAVGYAWRKPAVDGPGLVMPPVGADEPAPASGSPTAQD